MALAGRRADGTEFPAEVSLSSIETEEGLMVCAAIRDVTERIEAQRERARLETQLERDRLERQLHQSQRLEVLDSSPAVLPTISTICLPRSSTT